MGGEQGREGERERKAAGLSKGRHGRGVEATGGLVVRAVSVEERARWELSAEGEEESAWGGSAGDGDGEEGEGRAMPASAADVAQVSRPKRRLAGKGQAWLTCAPCRRTKGSSSS